MPNILGQKMLELEKQIKGNFLSYYVDYLDKNFITKALPVEELYKLIKQINGNNVEQDLPNIKQWLFDKGCVKNDFDVVEFVALTLMGFLKTNSKNESVNIEVELSLENYKLLEKYAKVQDLSINDAAVRLILRSLLNTKKPKSSDLG